MAELKRPSRGRLVLRGMVWTTLSQVLHTLASFGAMLVLVRIILHEEHGWAGAVVGFAALVIVLRYGAFMAQA